MTRKETFLQKLPCRQAGMAEQGIAWRCPLLVSKRIRNMQALPVLWQTFPAPLRGGEHEYILLAGISTLLSPHFSPAVSWGPPDQKFWQL